MFFNKVGAPEYLSLEDRAISPVLVLGVGNILMSDDGVGVHVVERLKAHAVPRYVEIVDGGTMGFCLWNCLALRKKVIVVDAVDTGAPPGSVCRFIPEAHDTLNVTSAMSIHQLGIPYLIKIMRCMGTEPSSLVIVAVQPRVIAPGMSLSPEVEESVDAAVCFVRDEMIEQPVAINGKLRARIEVAVADTLNLSDEATCELIKGKAKENERVAALLKGKTIVKEIVLPGRMVNFVLKKEGKKEKRDG